MNPIGVHLGPGLSGLLVSTWVEKGEHRGSCALLRPPPSEMKINSSLVERLEPRVTRQARQGVHGLWPLMRLCGVTACAKGGWKLLPTRSMLPFHVFS